MDDTTNCDCGRPIAAHDVNSLLHGACFRCRAVGVGVTFQGGGGYGKQNFHDRTNAEFLRENDGPGTIPRPR